MALFFLSFLASLESAFATSNLETLGVATVKSYDDVGSEETKFCLGESVTFVLGALDFKGTSVDSIPWAISFNQVPISDDDLDQYLILDASVGPSLEDWEQETELTFEPLKQGCYQVTVDPLIFFATATQNVGSQEIVVADAPAKPELFGFDDVLMCDGGSIDGGFSSYTEGSVYMTLSHEWLDDSGTDLGQPDPRDGQPHRVRRPKPQRNICFRRFVCWDLRFGRGIQQHVRRLFDGSRGGNCCVSRVHIELCSDLCQ